MKADPLEVAERACRLLTDIEWTGVSCPACRALFRDGHTAVCELVAVRRLLAGHAERLPSPGKTGDE